MIFLLNFPWEWGKLERLLQIGIYGSIVLREKMMKIITYNKKCIKVTDRANRANDGISQLTLKVKNIQNKWGDLKDDLDASLKKYNRDVLGHIERLNDVHAKEVEVSVRLQTQRNLVKI